jgi:putative DNA methylase
MRIESGDETDRLARERGWTYWHHLFNPRQLIYLATARKYVTANTTFAFQQAVNLSSRLCGWNGAKGVGRWGSVEGVFVNQALNTLWAYGCRSIDGALSSDLQIREDSELSSKILKQVINSSSQDINYKADIFITDPPYGDAVKYEEILEFFIAWLRKNTPVEFANWVWDSRRALAIKGEDHDFKLSMVSAYKHMADCMPDNGIQVIMFTHQSGSIWADMANIVWASGLQVTAAWYVVTETDSALRDGQYVKGTILLVLRKRLQNLDAARDELAYELAEEVKRQVDLLTGLNKEAKVLYRDENLFEDADLQMAGYAAALRVLTRYKVIDGIDMPQESLRPRVRGQITMVDELIEFAVNIANEYLVPDGMEVSIWEKSTGIERLYLKMLDMESKGIFTVSNYQNFAKAFKVRDDSEITNETKANKSSLKSAKQLGKKGMNASDEFGPTILRSVLYAIHILEENKTKPEDVLHQLRDLVPDYYHERNRISALAEYISKKTSALRPEESSNAIVLRDLVRREKV